MRNYILAHVAMYAAVLAGVGMAKLLKEREEVKEQLRLLKRVTKKERKREEKKKELEEALRLLAKIEWAQQMAKAAKEEETA